MQPNIPIAYWMSNRFLNQSIHMELVIVLPKQIISVLYFPIKRNLTHLPSYASCKPGGQSRSSIQSTIKCLQILVPVHLYYLWLLQAFNSCLDYYINLLTGFPDSIGNTAIHLSLLKCRVFLNNKNLLYQSLLFAYLNILMVSPLPKQFLYSIINKDHS